MGLSTRIVNFISNLIPLYVEEEIKGIWAARSLGDGTLILPMDEEDDDSEDEFVTVHWQGDPNRQATVLGTFLASCAVVKYVEMHGVGQKNEHIQSELRHLARHFTVKTGAKLVFEMEEEEARLLQLLERAVRKIGNEAVTEIIKKSIGF
ncbi:hypothetical protein Q8A64_00155 [Oxalobacteraceae bacterium R-40]|uniref:Uncharacterized protein n=1 Tax=Keguizhuia sedimenti TaxID=3064264 RepID=A0ABU1BII5_9BURK|nr:hypothetical protein [Oxalobacteraceae bacterium R-40]